MANHMDDIPEPGGEPHLERDVVALLTPIPNGEVLAAYCALGAVKAEVLEAPGGTFAVLEDESESAAHNSAFLLSSLIKQVPILAMERRAGQIIVHQWLDAKQGDPVPPGIALDKAPSTITRVMTGALTIDRLKAENSESVYSTRMGRLKAIRRLRTFAKQAKKQLRGQSIARDGRE